MIYESHEWMVIASLLATQNIVINDFERFQIVNGFPPFYWDKIPPFYWVIDPIARGEYALSVGLMGQSTSLY